MSDFKLDTRGMIEVTGVDLRRMLKEAGVKEVTA